MRNNGLIVSGLSTRYVKFTGFNLLILLFFYTAMHFLLNGKEVKILPADRRGLIVPYSFGHYAMINSLKEWKAGEDRAHPIVDFYQKLLPAFWG